MKPFDGLKQKIASAIEPLRELIQRRTNDWLVGAMGVFILLNTVIILIPLLKSFYDVATKTTAAKKEVSQIEQDKKDETELVAERERKRDRLKEAERLLALGDVSLYLETFSSIASDTGVRLTSVRPTVPPPAKLKDVKQDENYRETYFEISAGAGYHQLGRFIQRIETHPAFVKIIRLTVTGIEEAPETHEVQMLVKMVMETDQVKDAPVQKT